MTERKAREGTGARLRSWLAESQTALPDSRARTPEHGGDASGQLDAETRRSILEQVERMAASRHFCNSRRYPVMLRHLVHETLAGRSDALKERTLGTVVFGRQPDYDTNADPVVRVSAGEIRKRIAQYYQSADHTHEIRLDLPVGSYVPLFLRPAATGDPSLQPPGGYAPALPPAAGTEGPGSEGAGLAGSYGSEPSHGPAMPPVHDPVTIEPTSVRRPLLGSFLRERLLWAVTAALLILRSLAFAHRLGYRRAPADNLGPGLSLLWKPLLKAQQPALFVLGVHSFDRQGHDISGLPHTSFPQTQRTLLSAMTQADMIALGDVISYNRLTTLLTQGAHAYTTQGAEDTTLTDLDHRSVVLVGGFNNLWTLRLEAPLRYRFVTINNAINVVQDTLHPEISWTLDTSQSALNGFRDYGIVSCFFDRQLEQTVVLIAGIGKSGTEAAANFASDNKLADEWLRQAHLNGHKNFEVLLYTDVLEGSHGPPHVMDTYTW